MKQITLFIISVFIPVLTNADNGPFGPSEPPLQSLVSESKPYVLEVAYALIPMVDEEASFDSIRLGSGVPSQQFLKSAQRLRISISDDDIGRISTESWPDFLYSVETRDENFLLRFYLRTELEGRQEIDTQVNLTESEWLLLGGLRREEKDSEILEYQVAIRIDPNGQEEAGGNAD